MDAERGWKTSGYVAEELIGYGASGQVWRGRTARTGRAVALKRIDCSNPAARRSAQAEAALLSTLDHPTLLRLHEVVTDGNALVLVLDLAEGGSMADLLARRGRLSPGEVITALTPIAAALAYAHDEGVIHCDVSAANVLFTAAGLPLLADLGTARLLGDTAAPHATLAYLDPSVAAGGPPSAPSDVFALAALTLHALCGRPLWVGDSAAAIVALAALGEIDDLDQRLAGTPGPLADVVRRGLSAIPHARGTAAEFALDLRHSGVPLSIELTAGRTSAVPARPVSAEPRPGAREQIQPVRGGRRRRAASGVAHRPRHAHAIPIGPAVAPVRTPLDRPAFTRPDESADRSAAVGVALTHAVRTRARPPVPPPRPAEHLAARWAALRPVRGRLIATSLLAVMLGVGVTVFVFWAPAGRASSALTPLAGSTVGTPAAAAIRTPGPTLTRATSASAVGWATVLAGLDSARETAFAGNDPSRLADVYVPGELLRQDAATLTRLVRPGCHIEGLRTSYAGVVLVARSATEVSIRADATLSPARVICGTVVAYTGARPMTRLAIGLRPVAGGYRIASLRIES